MAKPCMPDAASHQRCASVLACRLIKHQSTSCKTFQLLQHAIRSAALCWPAGWPGVDVHAAMPPAACHHVCAGLQGDQAFGGSLALYMNNEGAANDGVHNPITSFFQWAWDADADSTFGRQVGHLYSRAQSGTALLSLQAGCRRAALAPATQAYAGCPLYLYQPREKDDMLPCLLPCSPPNARKHSPAPLLACSGGLVSSDWANMDWAKIGFLVGNTTTYPTGLGLVPWYLPDFTTSKLPGHDPWSCVQPLQAGHLGDTWVPECGQTCTLDVQLPVSCCTWLVG